MGAEQPALATAHLGSRLCGHRNPWIRQRQSVLASDVTAMSLITGTGDQVGLIKPRRTFQEAVVHLGALGVVTELTLAIEPTS